MKYTKRNMVELFFQKNGGIISCILIHGWIFIQPFGEFKIIRINIVPNKEQCKILFTLILCLTVFFFLQAKERTIYSITNIFAFLLTMNFFKWMKTSSQSSWSYES